MCYTWGMKQIRVNLTEDEWKEIRKAAVEANMPLHDYVAHLIRFGLGGEVKP